LHIAGLLGASSMSAPHVLAGRQVTHSGVHCVASSNTPAIPRPIRRVTPVRRLRKRRFEKLLQERCDTVDATLAIR
jgi:hypothetical protein